ncbi:hypothetical protein [Streptomyces mobaraensis]|uniref:Uncharacterized protein n=1 Tax=Streptomyces mobaraensis TaxID=35621 RepID=A0A5N5W348_STRMB|nr:hypothetical protein [Streptomyces mobaraensis]KAB7835786.1 hypothetical protein FRZ00_26600 [Streptomyces mobaraensis]
MAAGRRARRAQHGGHLSIAARRLAEHITATDTAYSDPTARSWLLTTDPRATEPLHSMATRVPSLTDLAQACADELATRTKAVTGERA